MLLVLKNMIIKNLSKKVKLLVFDKIKHILKKISMNIYEYGIDEEILHSAFQQSLIKRHISRLLISNFNGDGGHNINISKNFLGFGLLHYGIIRNIKPNNILCIGSRKGFIPAILALACKDNAKGHVDFVDAGYDRDNINHWSGIGWWKKIDPQRHFAFFGINKYITSYIMTTKEFSQKYPNRTYDYVYIDGDHSYEGVKLDYSLFWPKLTKYGFMIFHDVYVKHTKDLGNFGVWKLWKELKYNTKIIFPFPKDSGLGFIQKI